MNVAIFTIILILCSAVAFASPATQPARPTTVRVAAVQCSSDLGAVKENIAKLTKLCEEAARGGARIIVLPEAAITGYVSQDLKTNWHLPGWPIEKAFVGRNPTESAQTVPGPTTEHFCALAKRLGAYITVPFVETDRTRPDRTRFFNTVCLASPEGKLVAHYRKLTPWPYPEKSWATPGDRGVQTFDTEFGRVGLAICFDIHTILEKYRPHNIWALLYPIAWVDANHPAEWYWHELPTKLSKFNHHLIGANWSVDEKQPWFGYGFSTILSPDGKVLATARSLHGSEIIYADIPTGP